MFSAKIVYVRYLGIDFGSKRIGVAYSDENGDFALPLCVLSNSDSVVSEVVRLAREKEVIAIVVGESKNYEGKDNLIMKDTNVFVEELKRVSGLPLYFEPEFMTSAHAEKTQGKHDLLDASAAALILQSFLDKKRNGGLAQSV